MGHGGGGLWTEAEDDINIQLGGGWGVRVGGGVRGGGTLWREVQVSPAVVVVSMTCTRITAAVQQ